MPLQDELSKVPWLALDPHNDRYLSLAPLWDGHGWRLWLPVPGHGLIETKPVGLAEGAYVATEPAAPADLNFPFVEFIWKRANWPNVHHWLTAIEQDVHQIAASLGKIDFFWAMRDRIPDQQGLARFVASEVEYLLMICRSVLDELQEVLRNIWEHIRLLDKMEQRRKGPLPPSFAKMVIHDQKLMSAQDIRTRRRIPLPLASAYEAAGAFVHVLRTLRDGVVHGGSQRR